MAIHRASKASEIPPAEIPPGADMPAWVVSELLQVELKSNQAPIVHFDIPPGAVHNNTRISLPSPWDRRTGAPFIFDIHVEQQGSAGLPAQVWRYQLHFDERDLLEDQALQDQGIHKARGRAAYSRVEVLERFTMPSPFKYVPLRSIRSPCAPFDPREVPSRFFLQDEKLPSPAYRSTAHNSGLTPGRRALLAQYTFARLTEEGEGYNNQGCDEG